MTLASLARRMVFVLTGLLLALAAAVAMVILAVNTRTGEEALRQRLERILADATGARVSIGHLGGTLVSGVSARDVSLVFPGGTRMAASELTGSYALPALVSGRFVIGSARARGARIRLVHDAAGWGFAGPAAPADEAPTVLPELRILHVTVEDGRAAVILADATPPQRFVLSSLGLEAGFAMDSRTIRIDVATLHGVPRGLDISPLSAKATITVAASGDEVEVAGLDLATRRSRLSGDVRLVTGRRVDAHLDLAPLSARELRAIVPAASIGADLDGAIVARGPWRRIATRATLRTPRSGALRLFGVLDAAGSSLPYRATASVRHLDLVAIDPTLPVSDLTGHVHGRGTLTSLQTPLDVRLRLGPSAIAGTAVDNARLAGRITGDGLDAHGFVGAAGARVALDGGLSWAGEPVYHARTRVELAKLDAIAPGLAGDLRLHAHIEGRGFRAPGRTATVRARIDGGQVRGVPLERGRATLALRGDTLDVQSGSVLAAGLRADGTGTVDLGRETVDASATVSGDLARGARAAGADVAGTVTARVQARGSLHALALDGTATGENVRSGRTSIERGAVKASLTGVGGDSAGGRVTLDLGGLRNGGLSPWTATVGADWQRARATDTAAVTVTGHDEDGARLATHATIRRAPAGDLGAQLTDLSLATAQHGTWTLVRPATLALTGSTLSVDRLEVGAGSQRVSVAGRAGATGPADATAEWQSIDLAEICRLRTLACTGTTAGTVKLSGTAAAPVLALTARADGLVVDRSPTTAMTLTGTYADRSLSLRGTVTEAQTGQLDVTGIVPVDLAWEGPRRDLGAAPVDVTVHTDGLDLAVLRLFAPETIRQSAGQVVGDLRLRGRLDDPHADGRLALHDGKVMLAATGVTYDGIEVTATAAGQTIDIERVHARAGHGTLDGSGSMALVVTRTTPFALRLTLHDFLAVALPGVRGGDRRHAHGRGSHRVSGDPRGADAEPPHGPSHRPHLDVGTQPRAGPDDRGHRAAGDRGRDGSRAGGTIRRRRRALARRRHPHHTRRLDPPRRCGRRAGGEPAARQGSVPSAVHQRRPPPGARLVRVPGPALRPRRGAGHLRR